MDDRIWKRGKLESPTLFGIVFFHIHLATTSLRLPAIGLRYVHGANMGGELYHCVADCALVR